MRKSTTPKKNHYVPQFILREFTKDGFLYVFDKETGEVRRSKPVNVFAVRNLYQDDVELRYSVLEGQFSVKLKMIFRWLREGGPKPKDEDILAYCRGLVFTQLHRTPYAKEISKSAIDDYDVEGLLEELKAEGHEDLDEDEVRAAAERQREDGLKDRGSRLWSHALLNFIDNPLEMGSTLLPAIFEKGVVFGITESAFVLGDRGAVSTATPERPFTDPDGELFFPVSPDIAISIGGLRNRIGRVEVSKAVTRKVNRSTMECCRRNVVSHSEKLLHSLSNPR